jgi:hypothetical protein
MSVLGCMWMFPDDACALLSVEGFDGEERSVDVQYNA